MDINGVVGDIIGIVGPILFIVISIYVLAVFGNAIAPFRRNASSRYNLSRYFCFGLYFRYPGG